MKHIFLKRTNPEKTLVLFHGTGGTEEDLIPIGKRIDPEANILSLRGTVNEHGMNRFFKRLEEGIFDEDDIQIRAEEIIKFLETVSKEYEFSLDHLTGIGYSNGANIIAALYYLYGNKFSKAILFHAMVPLKETPTTSLENTQIFMGAGENDPIVPYKNTQRLAKQFRTMKSEVTVHTYSNGHSLTADEVNDAAIWYHG